MAAAHKVLPYEILGRGGSTVELSFQPRRSIQNREYIDTSGLAVAKW